jgi:hypothetical protein
MKSIPESMNHHRRIEERAVLQQPQGIPSGVPDPSQLPNAANAQGVATPGYAGHRPPNPPDQPGPPDQPNPLAAELPHQFMSARRLREQFGLAAPYSEGKRIGYGLLWAAWSLILTIAGFGLLFGGSVLSGLLGLLLAFFAGHYDYRIWSWQAKRLVFFIIW